MFGNKPGTNQKRPAGSWLQGCDNAISGIVKVRLVGE